MTQPLTVGDARRLIAAALNRFADHFAQQLEENGGLFDEAAVTRDIAFARTFAGNVTGWTHTTRLREFLEDGKTANLAAAFAGELLDIPDDASAADWFTCEYCSSQFGITGGSGTAEDQAAQEYFDGQVRHHEDSLCLLDVEPTDQRPEEVSRR